MRVRIILYLEATKREVARGVVDVPDDTPLPLDGLPVTVGQQTSLGVTEGLPEGPLLARMEAL